MSKNDKVKKDKKTKKQLAFKYVVLDKKNYLYCKNSGGIK